MVANNGVVVCWGGGFVIASAAVFFDINILPNGMCDAVCRIVEGHIHLDKFFDRKCAATLAERGIRKLEDGSYQFTRDIRVKSVSSFNL